MVNIDAGTIFATLKTNVSQFKTDMKQADQSMEQTTDVSNRVTQKMATNSEEISGLRKQAANEGRLATEDENKRIGALQKENTELGEQKKALGGVGRGADKAGRSMNLFGLAAAGAAVGLISMTGTGSAAIEILKGTFEAGLDVMLDDALAFNPFNAITEALTGKGSSQLSQEWGISAGELMQGGLDSMSDTIIAFDWGGMWDSAGEKITKGFSENVTGPINTEGGKATEGWGEKITEGWEEYVATPLAGAGGKFDQLISDAETGFGGIAVEAGALGPKLETELESAGDAMTDFAEDPIGAIQTGFGEAVKKAEEFTGLDIEGPVGAMGVVLNTVAIGPAEDLRKKFEDLNEDGKQFVLEAGADIIKWAEDAGKALDGAKEKAGEFWDELGKKAGDAGQSAQDSWNGFWGTGGG